MNEITRIHLARTSYEIDVLAKKELEKYLTAVRKSLGDESDIIEEVEIRMTEILATRGVVKDSVITENDVKAIKDQLGEPKEFSEKEDDDKGEKSIADKIKQQFTEKKFFLDTENKMIGGVVAGLAAYTGWDVTLLRILLVILTLFTAVIPFIVLYIIVWICAPEAKTASDRLSMKGEPVNLETIKQITGDTVKKVGETANEVAQKVSDKTKSSMSIILRIIIGFFGVIGMIISILILTALIPTVIIGSFTVVGMEIALKPLFAASAVLAITSIFTIAIIGIILSVALIRAKFGRSTRIGLIVALMFIIALTTSSVITGGIWLSEVGRDDAIKTMNHLANRGRSAKVMSIDDLDSFNSIDITTLSARVELIPSDSFALEANLPAGIAEPNWGVSNGNLFFYAEHNRRLFGSFTFGVFNDYYVRIFYPEGSVFENARIISVSGDVNFDATVETLWAETVTGDINVTASEIRDVNLISVSGDIILSAAYQEYSTDLRISTTSGDIKVNNLLWHDLKIDTVSGNVIVTGESNGASLINTTSGDIRLQLQSFARNHSRKIQTVTGIINIDGNNYRRLVDHTNDNFFERIDMKTTSGDVNLIFD